MYFLFKSKKNDAYLQKNIREKVSKVVNTSVKETENQQLKNRNAPQRQKKDFWSNIPWKWLLGMGFRWIVQDGLHLDLQEKIAALVQRLLKKP